MDSRDERIRELEREVRRLKADARRRMDELMDAEEATRVYRRLAHRLLVEKDRAKSED